MEELTEEEFRDLSNLNFWPWAAAQAAERYLDSHRRLVAAIIVHSDSYEGRIIHAKMQEVLRLEDQLANYNLIVTIGSTCKFLKSIVPKYPSMDIAYQAAIHLRTEGLILRNMIEHGVENTKAQAKGTPRGGYVRKANLLRNLPGNKSGSADATSTIVDDDGHWLGGRLNVERVVHELGPIRAAAKILLPEWWSRVFP